MRGLTAHHFTSDDALGVLHRNPALAAFYVHDERNHQNHNADQQQHGWRGEGAPGISANFVDQVGDAARQSNHDAGEDQKRHAVSDAAFRNLLAQPHDESAARSEG